MSNFHWETFDLFVLWHDDCSYYSGSSTLVFFVGVASGSVSAGFYGSNKDVRRKAYQMVGGRAVGRGKQQFCPGRLVGCW